VFVRCTGLLKFEGSKELTLKPPLLISVELDSAEEGAELAEFKRLLNDIPEPSIKFAPVLYLWTDREAARHIKAKKCW
ncbi:MAG: hypothetical protein VB122_04120, partial [Erysipelotrichales bacterium]|nr:hypothetical protein [Erysipelotrichales bacterium]